MNVLIVYESQYGHARQIADAIAKGVRERGVSGAVSTARVYSVRTAPATVPDDIDMVIMGAPLPAFSRQPAAGLTRGSQLDRILDLQPGIRDWLDVAIIPPKVRLVAFDIRLKRWFDSAGAATSAAEALSQAGIKNVERGGTFWVTETLGPIAPSELAKATEWGRELAHQPT